MSDCRRTKEELVAWLNGALDDAARRHIEEHCAACPDCAEAFAVARALKGTLRHVASSPATPPAAFDEALHLRLVAATHERRAAIPFRQGLFTRPVIAAAALLLCIVAIAAALLVSHPADRDATADEGTLISTAEVKAGEPVTIELSYEAARDIAEVTVSIELDPGLSFFSGVPSIAARKTLRWSGPLKEGMNLIPFVVTVERTGTRRISTTAIYEGQRHRHRVVLSADEFKVVIAQYRFPPEALDARFN